MSKQRTLKAAAGQRVRVWNFAEDSKLVTHELVNSMNEEISCYTNKVIFFFMSNPWMK